eukprot:TRINITY_DN16385_c0_g1_i1.p1 TRINITY_DN16385_c0_g1~~TRINITY_DN16385_c0_g1_i1.p1  ORF type:complete len:314 (+),score=67.03 TRINITY_DN16385_c0_g1_i1:35-976(+)
MSAEYHAPIELYEYVCPNCNDPTPDFVEDSRNGDMICQRCGLVCPERVIDLTAEKRNFKDSDVNHARTSKVDDLLPGEGLATAIGQAPKGKKGTNLSQLNSRTQKTNKEQKLTEGYRAIDHIANVLQVQNNVIQGAKEIYNQFERKRANARIHLDPLVCAVLYIASKRSSSRTFKDISKKTNVPYKQITEAYKLIKKLIPEVCSVEPASSADLVPGIVQKLNLPHKVRVYAQEVSHEATKHLEGKNPSTIAAVSVWLTAKTMGMEKSAKDVAEAADISHTTVRNVSRELTPFHDQVIPAKLKEEIKNGVVFSS